MLHDGFIFLMSDNQVEFDSLFWCEDLSLVFSLGGKKLVCDCINIWMFWNKLNPEFVSDLKLIQLNWEAF
jgi:hypothetical protein